MKVVVLGSSSSGNSTYVEMNDIKFLIDAGLQFGDMKEKLFSLGVDPSELNFIIVTHAHTDHVKSLHSFNRVYGTPIYIGIDTFNEYGKKDLIKNYTFIDEIDALFGINIIKIPISHDKKGFGYVFESGNHSLVYIADTGMINVRYHNLLKNKEIYLMESNHNVEMEMNGSKDEITKIRNIGDEGHLSNEQCAMYLSKFVGDNTKYIMLIHISDNDNTYEEALRVNKEITNDNIKLYCAYKDKVSEVIKI